MNQLDTKFGEFGGMYVPELLIPALDQLEKAFLDAKDDPTFNEEFLSLLKDYAGRPTSMTLTRNLAFFVLHNEGVCAVKNTFCTRHDSCAVLFGVHTFTRRLNAN